VRRRGWIGEPEFEDAIAACNLLPGPASTQLSILCAWRVAGPAGAVVGGLAFILPGLVAILALSVVFLAGDTPLGVRAAAAGAGAAVPAVALHAAWSLAPGSLGRAASRARWALYVGAGALAAATAGPWVVLVLLACGAIEVVARGAAPRTPPLVAVPFAVATLPALTWMAFKVGALSYGGGFVIVPLMQHDATANGWLTAGRFLDAVALGQITPGPVTHTVAAVGYAAAGVGGGLLAAAVAFAPSFAFVLAGAARFDALRADRGVRAFLDGAGPAAVGAIAGAAVALARLLDEPWQFAVAAGAVALLFAGRRGVVLTLLAGAAAGIACELAGLSVPGG
jgi:chromate transporter